MEEAQNSGCHRDGYGRQSTTDATSPAAAQHQMTNFDDQGVPAHSGHVDIGGDLGMSRHDTTNDSDGSRQRTREEEDRERHERRLKLLDTLRFHQMDTRQMNIKRAYADTCQWFLQNPNYLEWLNADERPDQGFLWIKGKPGAGKSTLIKFILTHIREAAKGNIISFFFNARGDDLEKSTIGLYRSLLLQLLENHPESQYVLDPIPLGYQWTIESLETCFEEAVRHLKKKPLFCCIDALDECDEAQIRSMVSFFSELVDKKTRTNRLRVCFASRNYPEITDQRALSLILEDQKEHSEDIAHYIADKLDIGDSPRAEEVRVTLQEKASGVFMWVVLVIDILNREYDRGCQDDLYQKLQQLPGNLHDLFQDILTRGEDDKDGLILCIQWVLFSKRPLSPRELYFAILSGLEPASLANCHSWDITDEDIRKYILHNSKGLAESTKSQSPTVQFIHESVKDFLLQSNWLESLRWSSGGSDFQGQSHDALKRCCLTYIDQLGNGSLNPDDLQPFLAYAASNVLYHAEIAQSRGVGQQEFLRDFPIQAWREYEDCDNYSPTVSLLYVLAEHNLPHLIRAQYPYHSCFTVENERYGTPLFAALATGSTEAVQAFLEILTEHQRHDPVVYRMCKERAQEKPRESRFDHDFVYSPERGILSHIAEIGDGRILMLYLATERDTVDIEAPNQQGRTPIFWAAQSGNDDTIEVFVKQKANLEARDMAGWTPVWWAARNGGEAALQILLENGAHLESKDNQGRTPLWWAVEHKHTDMVQLLLKHGARIEDADQDGRTPLSWAAAEFSHENTIKVLLANGANTEAADQKGRTPLSWAATKRSNKEIFRALLEHGARTEAADQEGRTPLSRAVVEYSNENAIQILLEHGAQTTSADQRGRTPLSWAAAKYRNANAVRVLLEHGAQTEAADGDGRTPLSWAAAEFSNENTVEILLEKGADTEAVDREGRTPLSWAAAIYSNENTVRVLIERGNAKVEAVDRNGRTPLFWAAGKGRAGVVRILLESRADVEARDHDGLSPAAHAKATGFTHIRRMLEASS